MERKAKRGVSARSGRHLLSAGLLAAILNPALSSEQPGLAPENSPATSLAAIESRDDKTVTLSIDNDLFARGREDRDYTGGFNVTVDRAIKSETPFDRLFRSPRLFPRTNRLSTSGRHDTMQFGLSIFTPDDIGSKEPLASDRPYANLLFLRSVSHTLSTSRNVLTQEGLTVGLLGTNVARELQTAIHRHSNSQVPQGYDHQISDGGELTAQYSLSRHTLLTESARQGRRDLKLSVDGAIGFISEAAVGIDVRWGRITSPWWRSISSTANYSPRSLPPTRYKSNRDLYVFAGVKIVARAYNALLQGQFRHSDVTYDSSELHQLMSDAWIGLAVDFDRVRLTFALRAQSPEIRRTQASRTLRWASISFTRRSL